MFFPETGTPMRKIDRMRMLFADWLPEPFTVAIWTEKSFTTTPPVLLGAATCVVIRA
jgi:hypothetical protein